ncbi:rhomboid family protein [Hymenobacter negativus]|uniref:Rhomboid family intramembrane serine protease n=1 Tax=Hymenobacter negativus TaxID=2795026 RepID=A0ABS3QI42_9BACT|nr:rhomboid family intramembrane serine protease [Hymenobacter negativus]MBO2010925.1 rhomboid family intramembrane serine protease [Hymenobacter negativus]
MTEFGIIGLLILVATFLVSYKGFKSPEYFNQYAFRIKDIRYGRQYYRLLTSGLLHTGWVHLLLNFLTFYYFSSGVEMMVGFGNYFIIYLASLIGGSLVSLALHWNEDDYTAVGASGAISGLVFAGLALFPGMEVGWPGLYVPGWLYGMLYVVYCAYGITTRRDNIGHDAHLGGGLMGLLTVIIMRPELLKINYLVIAAILVPTVAFAYLLIKKPEGLLRGNFFSSPDYQTLDDRYQAQKRQQEADLDELLDKISRKGLDSLSAREKKELEKLSR